MTDCILWTKSFRKNGYGQQMTWNPETKRMKNMTAHRWTWEQAHGPIPPGCNVLHKCDNRGCVNLDHLELGSQKTNLRQMIDRGRGNKAFGVNQGLAKLDDDKVREIRQKLAGGAKVAHLASEYGVGRTAIHGVKKGLTWKHVV